MVYGNEEGRVKIAAHLGEDLTKCSKLILLDVKASRSLLSDVSRNGLSQGILIRAVLRQMPSLLLRDVVLVKYF